MEAGTGIFSVILGFPENIPFNLLIPEIDRNIKCLGFSVKTFPRISYLGKVLFLGNPEEIVSISGFPEEKRAKPGFIIGLCPSHHGTM